MEQILVWDKIIFTSAKNALQVHYFRAIPQYAMEPSFQALGHQTGGQDSLELIAAAVAHQTPHDQPDAQYAATKTS